MAHGEIHRLPQPLCHLCIVHLWLLPLVAVLAAVSRIQAEGVLLRLPCQRSHQGDPRCAQSLFVQDTAYVIVGPGEHPLCTTVITCCLTPTVLCHKLMCSLSAYQFWPLHVVYTPECRAETVDSNGCYRAWAALAQGPPTCFDHRLWGPIK